MRDNNQKLNYLIFQNIILIFSYFCIRIEYYGAAEPPVRCGESHLSGLTEPPIDSYSAWAGSRPYTSLMERSFDGSMLSMLILYESYEIRSMMASARVLSPLQICWYHSLSRNWEQKMVDDFFLRLWISSKRFLASDSVSEYSGRFYTPIPEIGNRSSDVKETALPF